VESVYRLAGGTRAAIALGPFDPSMMLVIDPVLVFSTFLGGSASSDSAADEGKAIAVGPDGSAYVAGNTNGVGFPATAGALGGGWSGDVDTFVVKLAPDGASLVYATYLGGEHASTTWPPSPSTRRQRLRRRKHGIA
jgi:hypothetical protein